MLIKSMLTSPKLPVAVLLFAVAQLTWLRAPTNSLWKLSIVVMEGGHFLIFPCLMLALWSFGRTSSGNAAAILYLASAFLFASPLLRAVQSAHRLQQNFSAGFGKNLSSTESFHRQHPLNWKELWLGINLPAIVPKEMVYANTDTGTLKLDFYPASHENAPCIISIHGGAWDSGDRKELSPLNAYLVSLGYAVAAIDYRLAPHYLHPAPIEDVKEALDFLRKHAEELEIDSSRIILLGRSSGGQIALQAAYTLKDSSIKGVMAFYAPADMVFGYSIPGNPLLLDSRKVLDHYIGASYFKEPDRYVAASPIEALNASSPPTLLLHGHPDVLVSYEHTKRMETKLTRLGVEHFTVDLPWATHGYDYVFSGPGSQISLYFIERFLEQVTR